MNAMERPSPNPLLAAALAYAARGWPVVALHGIRAGRCTCRRRHCGSPGKHPHPPHGATEATTDPAVLRRWWRRWPDANVGVVTGARSGIVVLDIDPRHGGDVSVEDLTAAHGRLPATAESRTGGGGRHLFYAHPAFHVPNAVDIAPGFDLRGDGGYAVAPPSRHVSGTDYVWVHPPAGTLARLPAWCLLLERHPLEREDHGGWRMDATAPIPEGRRNVTLASIAGSLRRRGATESELATALLAVNAARCLPPLDDAEVRRIARSIARYPVGGRTTQPREDTSGALPIDANVTHPPVGFITAAGWHGIRSGKRHGRAMSPARARSRTTMDDRGFFQEVERRLGCDQSRAEMITFAVFQELRDRLPEKEAADLEAQLPQPLKNLWFEPGRAGKPVEKTHRAEFVARVRARVPLHDDAESERAVRAVFGTLQHLLKSPHGLEGEAWDVFSVLPKDLKTLWIDARSSEEPRCL